MPSETTKFRIERAEARDAYGDTGSRRRLYAELAAESESVPGGVQWSLEGELFGPVFEHESVACVWRASTVSVQAPVKLVYLGGVPSEIPSESRDSENGR
jgi:hypothetical protein